MQFLEIMKEYSIAVLIIAFIVCGFTALIKKFVPDDYKKFLTFVPFILGIILYAIYLLITKGFSGILKPETITSGFECGAAATVYYVLYEQFIRQKKLPIAVSKEKLLITGMLTNIVELECLEEVSEKIVNILKGDTAESERIKTCEEIIKQSAVLNIKDSEIKILTKLIFSL